MTLTEYESWTAKLKELKEELLEHLHKDYKQDLENYETIRAETDKAEEKEFCEKRLKEITKYYIKNKKDIEQQFENYKSILCY